MDLFIIDSFNVFENKRILNLNFNPSSIELNLKNTVYFRRHATMLSQTLLSKEYLNQCFQFQHKAYTYLCFVNLIQFERFTLDMHLKDDQITSF